MKKLFQTTSLVSVLNVSDLTEALTWYGTWLGEPDETLMDGMAEWRIADNAWLQLVRLASIASRSKWRIADNAWLQLDATGETVTPSAAIIGVDDLAACRTALLEAGIAVGEIQDWEVVLSCDLHDPDGNKISLAQIISQQ